jgi:phosphonate transport system ATP-binding protein
VALTDVSLGIGGGESVALVGPSGSGKTTLLRLLNGTLRPSEGRVFCGDRDLGGVSSQTLRSVRAGIGFVPQDLALVPSLRVIHNVLSGRLGQQGYWQSLWSFLRPGLAQVERAHELLERVGIAEKLYERTDTLSGGQQQRVALARALYQDPHAILADEPVSSVDPARARDTVQLLTEISSERGLTLLVSLHDLELARAFFPRLIGLRDGRIQFDRPTGSIAEQEYADLYRIGQAAAGDDA